MSRKVSGIGGKFRRKAVSAKFYEAKTRANRAAQIFGTSNKGKVIRAGGHRGLPVKNVEAGWHKGTEIVGSYGGVSAKDGVEISKEAKEENSYDTCGVNLSALVPGYKNNRVGITPLEQQPAQPFKNSNPLLSGVGITPKESI